MLPSVTCILLTADRPEMTVRAIECFRNQTYKGKMELLIFDTSRQPSAIKKHAVTSDGVYYVEAESKPDDTIGSLRNDANALTRSDIIAHWDSDDWSHPERITEQVGALQRFEAYVAGYNSMLFWDQTVRGSWLYQHPLSSYCLGTSFTYWRWAWLKKPFANAMQGEDRLWLSGQKRVSWSSLIPGMPSVDFSPRMIGLIHGGNTSAYRLEDRLKSLGEWQRAYGADTLCTETFA